MVAVYFEHYRHDLVRLTQKLIFEIRTSHKTQPTVISYELPKLATGAAEATENVHGVLDLIERCH